VAYDEALAERVRLLLEGHEVVVEKKMFGGLAFMLNGNMCCGVLKDELILRLGPEGGDLALDEPHTRPMDFTGRPMSSFVVVTPPGIESDDALEAWIDRAVDYASSLPPK
jgi:TfoX/Sxy family transcriptional regulator of competence genes